MRHPGISCGCIVWLVGLLLYALHEGAVARSVIQEKNVAYLTAAPFVVLTGANAAYFDRLENLVGSIHENDVATTWMVVYDLGLRPEQRAIAENWVTPSLSLSLSFSLSLSLSPPLFFVFFIS